MKKIKISTVLGTFMMALTIVSTAGTFYLFMGVKGLLVMMILLLGIFVSYILINE